MPIILRNAASIRLLEPLGLEAQDEYELDEAQVTVQVRYRPNSSRWEGASGIRS